MAVRGNGLMGESVEAPSYQAIEATAWQVGEAGGGVEGGRVMLMIEYLDG